MEGDKIKKFPDYKTAKWDKRKEIILREMHDDYEELESLNKDYLNGKIKEVKYHLLLSLCFSRIPKMNSYKAGVGNAMDACRNKLTNLHLLLSCYKKE